MEQEAYKIVDDFLRYLHNSSQAEAINFDRYSKEGRRTINIMSDYKLISFRSASPASLIDITDMGKRLPLLV
jgi:hypothetical protein